MKNSEHSNKEKIIFIKQILTDSWVDTLSKNNQVVLISHPSAHSHEVKKNIRMIPVRYIFFGIRYLVKNLAPSHQIHIPKYGLGLKRVLDAEMPDMVFAVELFEWTTLQCLRYTKRNDCQLYIFSETQRYPRSWFSRTVLRGFMWYLQRNPKHVTGVFVWTKRGQEWFASEMPNFKTHLLPAPVDVAQFYPVEQKEWLPQGRLRVLMNARFVALKEHRTLFAAVAKLKDAGVSVAVSLIGRGGHLQEELMAYAVELGIGEQITLLEPVPPEQLREIYTAHDVLVLPSNREAIGMVVPEAMACGLPTITSEAVGANTYVKEGVTGFIFATSNADALAEKLRLLTDADTAARMGAAAAQEIREHYSVEVLGKKLETILAADERV